MKILFVSHLAIGDFVYLQNYFKLFAQKYPNLKIDLLDLCIINATVPSQLYLCAFSITIFITDENE